MTTNDKKEAIKKFSKTLKFRQRIITTDQENLSLETLFDEEQKKAYKEKPSGLWYGFGNNWIDFLLDGDYTEYKYNYDKCWFNTKVKQITHIFKIELNDSIYRITDVNSLKYFENSYASKYKEEINWLKVSKKYNGIEVKFNHTDAFYSCTWNFLKKSYWIWGWDINSGCIWNKNAIKKITLLKCWVPNWQEHP